VVVQVNTDNNANTDDNDTNNALQQECSKRVCSGRNVAMLTWIPAGRVRDADKDVGCIAQRHIVFKDGAQSLPNRTVLGILKTQRVHGPGHYVAGTELTWFGPRVGSNRRVCRTACGGVSYSGTGMIQKATRWRFWGETASWDDCGSCGTTVSGSLS
jgi:hypothetical protein